MGHKFQNTDLFNRRRPEGIGRLLGVRRLLFVGAMFFQHNERQHVMPVDPFRMPVDDFLRLIHHGMGAFFRNVFPFHQRTHAPDGDDFMRDVFGISRQRRAEQVGIRDESVQCATNASGGVRQFECWIAPEDATDVTIGNARRGIEERGA